MQNRRQTFRQLLSAAHRLPVNLTHEETSLRVKAVLVNLSLGGMCVETRDRRLAEHDAWSATFCLDGKLMEVPVERIFAPRDGRICYGFRFVPPGGLTEREAQEKAICRFLIEQARGERRRMREALAERVS